MSNQELEKRIAKLEETIKTLEEACEKTTKIVNHYESMTSGVRWVFVIMAGIAAFVASIKAVFGKIFIP